MSTLGRCAIICRAGIWTKKRANEEVCDEELCAVYDSDVDDDYMDDWDIFFV